MKLYLKETDGGAEYYSTANGKNILKAVCLRTDGDELEIMGYDKLKAAGFKSVVLPDGTRKKL